MRAECIAFKNRRESNSVTSAASRNCFANFVLFDMALLLMKAMKLLRWHVMQSIDDRI